MFKLLIESTKDISEISINFADGTSVVKSSESESHETTKAVEPAKPDKKPKPNVPKPKEPNFSEARRELLDLDDSNNTPNIKQSQVSKPKIANHDRQVKVATELQNLDI